MPSHTGFLTYLLGMFPTLRENVQNIGQTFLGHHQIEYRGVEPIVMSAIVMMVVIALASSARRVLRSKASVEPDDTLTLRTFFEAFFGMFYDVVKGVMGAERARKYFPIIGAAAAFIFFSNLCSLIPGLNPPTSSLNVTAGCAIYILIAFNYFGLKENGWAYIAHLAGPNPYLAPLVFPIEAFSTFIVRPLTLSIRLMLNIAVDHLVGSIFLGLIAFLVPVPLMFLATIVIVVQTLVFCLLSSIYIGLATEDMHHHH